MYLSTNVYIATSFSMYKRCYPRHRAKGYDVCRPGPRGLRLPQPCLVDPPYHQPRTSLWRYLPLLYHTAGLVPFVYRGVAGEVVHQSSSALRAGREECGTSTRPTLHQQEDSWCRHRSPGLPPPGGVAPSSTTLTMLKGQ